MRTLRGLCVAGALCACWPAMPAETPPPPPDSSAPTGPATPHVRVYVDPATGEIGAPRDADALPKVGGPVSDKALRVPRLLPNGALTLPPRATAHYLRATVGPDGSVQTTCANHPEE